MNDSQLGLFGGVESDSVAVANFKRFHGENPHVYERLVELALRLRRRGHERYGMKGLFEVLRWHYALETTDQNFKLCNNYTAFYARLIMQREPELKDFFRTRPSDADDM